MNDPLSRSLREEREMLIAHRDLLRRTLTEIVELVDVGEDDAEDLLHQIGNKAEAALKL